VIEQVMRNAPAEHHLDRVQYTDFKTYLPGDILTKVDRASMAHSLEVRVPVLDHHLVEWAAGLAPEAKLKGRQGKYIFKKALEPHVAPEILYREKMGFGVPLADWFRGPLRDRVGSALTGPVLQDTGLFDRAAVAKLVDQHCAGLRDHSAALWALLMFESFIRNVHENAPAREAREHERQALPT
jgi:asparagine synthase (glutamine-hydrolysing)